MTALALRRVSWGHPEIPAAILAACGWTLLIALSAGPPEVQAMHAEAHQAAPWLAPLIGWLLMCVAMMVPSTLPHARQLALSAVWHRRQRTIAIFLASYLGVWIAFGLVALAFLGSAQRLLGLGPTALLALALIAAAAWTRSPWKWRSLRACHLGLPLAPHGGRADRACAAAGLRYGARCLVASWPLMIAMAAAGHGDLALMALLAPIVAAEKLVVRPSRLGPRTAVVLVAAALIVIAGYQVDSHAGLVAI